MSGGFTGRTVVQLFHKREASLAWAARSEDTRGGAQPGPLIP
jgi:hypothetical protein